METAADTFKEGHGTAVSQNTFRFTVSFKNVAATSEARLAPESGLPARRPTRPFSASTLLRPPAVNNFILPPSRRISSWRSSDKPTNRRGVLPSLKTNLDHVFGIQREMMADGNSALRADRQVARFHVRFAQWREEWIVRGGRTERGSPTANRLILAAAERYFSSSMGDTVRTSPILSKPYPESSAGSSDAESISRAIRSRMALAY